MKSKYPNKIDSSAELPIIKDSLTELRAEVFNSYRSAIINLEKTLGLNPNGTSGSTVASRLNASLDEDGNIKKEALDYLNLLKGPISNSDVKSDANISEEKLKLDFSTNFLYNQALSLKRLVDEIDRFLDEINSKLSAHINIEALNRHSAKSISIEEKNLSLENSTSLISLDSQTLQDFAEKVIYNHIHYSGSLISDSNRSHSADQIFFDNTKVQDVVLESSIQGVIENIVLADAEYLRAVVLNLASNSRLRGGSVNQPKDGTKAKVVASGAAEISSVSPDNSFIVALSLDVTIDKDIKHMDLIELTGFPDQKFDGFYYVKEEYASGSTVSAISVYGEMNKDFYSRAISYVVYKNNFVDYNSVGLNLAPRYLSSYSGLPYMICCDPNSAKVVSSGIRPHEISSSNNEIKIQIDGSDSYTINIYNSDIKTKFGHINLDSIVESINKYASENNLPFAATKTTTSSQDELAIFHLVPNIDIDSSDRSIKILDSNAVSSLGLLLEKDVEYFGSGNNRIVVNGSLISKHFKYEKIFNFSMSSNKISRADGSFISDGIKNGDLIFIEDAVSSSDNGCFLVEQVSDFELEVDHLFSNSSSEDTVAIVLKNTLSIKDETFKELSIPSLIGSSGSMYFDIYYNEKDFSLFRDKKMEVSGLPNSTSISINISKMSENIVKKGEQVKINIDPSGMVSFVDADLSVSSETKITSTGKYIVYNLSKDKYIELDVYVSGSPFSALSVILYGTSDAKFKSLKVGSFLFSNILGKVFGSVGPESGIPTFLSEAQAGPIDESKISDSFVENKIGLPNFEAIGNFVAFGLSKSGSHTYDSSAGTLTLSLNGGIAYIGGRRMVFSPKENLLFLDIDSSKKYYLTINKLGYINLKEHLNDSTYSNYSPSFDKEELSIGFFDPSVDSYIELIISLDSINEKLDKVLFVSPSFQDSGSNISPNLKKSHFSNINDAVNYAKYFSKISGGTYTPEICLLDGYHYVSKPVSLDFPLNIYGMSNDCFISPIFGSGISMTTGDISTSNVVFQESNSIFNISYDENEVVGFSMKNITFKYESLSNGIFCALLFSKNVELDTSKENWSSNGVFLENITFDSYEDSYTNSTTYKLMVPVLFQELDSSSVIKPSQNFNDIYIKNLTFFSSNIKNSAILFYCTGNLNKMSNIKSDGCRLISHTVFGPTHPAQVFGCRSSIMPASSIDVFNASRLFSINSVFEENTVTT